VAIPLSFAVLARNPDRIGMTKQSALQLMRQIFSLWVHPIDKLDLLLSAARLDLFFSADGLIRAFKDFVIYQFFGLIFFGEG